MRYSIMITPFCKMRTPFQFSNNAIFNVKYLPFWHHDNWVLQCHNCSQNSVIRSTKYRYRRQTLSLLSSQTESKPDEVEDHNFSALCLKCCLIASSANLCSVKAGANSLIYELRRLHSIDIRQAVERADSFGIVVSRRKPAIKATEIRTAFPAVTNRVKCRSECRPLDIKFYWLALRSLARSRGSKSPGITSGP